jgi:hypothetical protein
MGLVVYEPKLRIHCSYKEVHCCRDRGNCLLNGLLPLTAQTESPRRGWRIMLRFPGACVLPVPGRCSCTNASKDDRAELGRVEFVAWRKTA